MLCSYLAGPIHCLLCADADLDAPSTTSEANPPMPATQTPHTHGLLYAAALREARLAATTMHGASAAIMATPDLSSEGMDHAHALGFRADPPTSAKASPKPALLYGSKSIPAPRAVLDHLPSGGPKASSEAGPAAEAAAGLQPCLASRAAVPEPAPAISRVGAEGHNEGSIRGPVIEAAASQKHGTADLKASKQPCMPVATAASLEIPRAESTAKVASAHTADPTAVPPRDAATAPTVDAAAAPTAEAPAARNELYTDSANDAEVPFPGFACPSPATHACETPTCPRRFQPTPIRLAAALAPRSAQPMPAAPALAVGGNGVDPPEVGAPLLLHRLFKPASLQIPEGMELCLRPVPAPLDLSTWTTRARSLRALRDMFALDGVSLQLLQRSSGSQGMQVGRVPVLQPGGVPRANLKQHPHRAAVGWSNAVKAPIHDSVAAQQMRVGPKVPARTVRKMSDIPGHGRRLNWRTKGADGHPENPPEHFAPRPGQSQMPRGLPTSSGQAPTPSGYTRVYTNSSLAETPMESSPPTGSGSQYDPSAGSSRGSRLSQSSAAMSIQYPQQQLRGVLGQPRDPGQGFRQNLSPSILLSTFDDHDSEDSLDLEMPGGSQGTTRRDLLDEIAYAGNTSRQGWEDPDLVSTQDSEFTLHPDAEDSATGELR